MNDRMKELGFEAVDVKALDINPFTAIGDRWTLVTAGDETSSNTMTASWGFMGVMWGKPAVTMAIRQSRHTKGFIDNADRFTVSFYPDDMKKALGFCGGKSGRDFEPNGKAKAAGLTALSVDGTTAYEEAELILVCRKMYAGMLEENDLADKSIIGTFYGDKDWHTAYIAEITAAYKKNIAK